MRWLLTPILCLTFLSGTAARSEAVTIWDIIDLTRAGLSEEVLLALIEVDGGVFNIDTPTLTRLKEAGVSERVIIALVRSGRSHPAQPAPDPPAEARPEPQVIVIEHERPIVQQVAVPVAVPVYVAVPVRPSRRLRLAARQQPVISATDFGIHGATASGFGVPVVYPGSTPAKDSEPLYWGWGGKRRPDTWPETRKNKKN